MTIRRALFWLILLAVLTTFNPLAWLVYWVDVTIWDWQHGNPY